VSELQNAHARRCVQREGGRDPELAVERDCRLFPVSFFSLLHDPYRHFLKQVGILPHRNLLQFLSSSMFPFTIQTEGRCGVEGHDGTLPRVYWLQVSSERH
jgi:hypothetical protein